MKIITFYTFLIIYLFHFDVSVCTSQTNTDFYIDLREVEMIPVFDRDLSYSYIEIIQPVHDHYVVIHDPPEGASVINRKGELQFRLDASGRGPFEIQRPRYVAYENQKVFIWDSGNLKFLVFDEDIGPDVELLGIRHAIDGFDVNKNGLVAVFQNPRFQDQYVHIYEINDSNRLAKRKDLGNLTNEGRTLFFMDNTGGVLWNENDLVWVEPSKTILNIYSIDKEEQIEIQFDEQLFEVRPSPIRADQDFNRNSFDDIKAYIKNNSRILSIRKLTEHIIVEMEHFEDEESIITYAIFDLDYNHLGRIELEESGWTNYIRGVDGNRLFYWGENYVNTGVINHIRVREITVERK